MLKILALILLGAIAPITYQNLSIWAANLLSIIPVLWIAGLYYCVHDKTAKKTFTTCLAAFIPFFISGVYWAYNALHNYGNAPAALAFGLTFLFACTLALSMSIPLPLINFIFKKQPTHQKVLFLYPASLTLFEWIRGHLILSGFPWLTLGYSQTQAVLNEFAPIIGVFGLSLLLYTLAGCLFVLTTTKHKTMTNRVLLFFILTAAALIPLHNKEFTYLDNDLSSAALIQGDIKQSTKYVPGQLEDTILKYNQLTHKAMKQAISKNINRRILVVWPESTIAGVINNQPKPTVTNQANDTRSPLAPYIKQLLAPSLELTKHNSAYLMTGAFYVANDPLQYYTSLITFAKGDTSNYQLYFKHNLVPFGEYYPLSFITDRIMSMLDINFSDLTPGPYHTPPLSIDTYKVTPLLCFDAAFPHFVAENSKQSQVIVLASDDSWFDSSSALNQQLQIAQMRALETGRYVLSANNSGHTAIINQHGVVTQDIPTLKAGFLTGTFRKAHGQTPFMQWGTPLDFGLILIMLIFGGLPISRKLN